MSTLLGTEIRLGDSFDAFAYVPLSFALATKEAPSIRHTGSGALTSEHLAEPESFTKLASGVVFGLRTQVRVFGRAKKTGLEMYE